MVNRARAVRNLPWWEETEADQPFEATIISERPTLPEIHNTWCILNCI